MKLSRLAFVTFAASCCAAALPQATPLGQPSPGLELLSRVAQKYANAKSYDIEIVQEFNSSSEYSRDYSRQIIRDAEAPGNRYFREGRSNTGSSIKVSDGKTVWTFHVNQHSYTQKPQNVDASEPHKITPLVELALMGAEGLREEWSRFVKNLNSAELLPDENLTLNGNSILCHVIRITSSDEKRTSGNRFYDKTIWIDIKREVVLKEEEHSRSVSANDLGLSAEREVIRTYTKVSLDEPLPDALFTFEPPANAELLEDFPDPEHSLNDISLAGRRIPSLMLKGADGSVTVIESFRGKPVLLDFWATWCAPCLASLPHLAKINAEATDKGLVFISVDQDQEAKTATEYLTNKSYIWTNYHDGDGAIQKLMGSAGIPRSVLVNAQGKVVYDSMTATEDELRKEIAKLGPEFASIAPKAPANPCLVANSDSPQK